MENHGETHYNPKKEYHTDSEFEMLNRSFDYVKPFFSLTLELVPVNSH